MVRELTPSIELILAELAEEVAALQVDWTRVRTDIDQRPDETMTHLARIAVQAEVTLPISLTEILEATQALLAQLDIETEGEPNVDAPGEAPS